MLYILSFITWGYIYLADQTDVARNINSAFHATVVIVCYLLSIQAYTLYYISFGYYSVDMINEMKNAIYRVQNNSRPSTHQIGIILHHIIVLASLNTLLCSDLGPYYYRTFFLAEISNGPLYVYWHLKKTGCANKLIIAVVLFAQLLTYGMLRLWLWCPIIFELYTAGKLSNLLILMALCMYLLSAIWCYKVCRILVYNIRKLRR